jgi:hypothetical protein
MFAIPFFKKLISFLTPLLPLLLFSFLLKELLGLVGSEAPVCRVIDFVPLGADEEDLTNGVEVEGVRGVTGS